MSLTRRMNSSGLPRLCQAAAWKVKSAILGQFQNSMTQQESMQCRMDVSVCHLTILITLGTAIGMADCIMMTTMAKPMVQLWVLSCKQLEPVMACAGLVVPWQNSSDMHVWLPTVLLESVGRL